MRVSRAVEGHAVVGLSAVWVGVLGVTGTIFLPYPGWLLTCVGASYVAVAVGATRALAADAPSAARTALPVVAASAVAATVAATLDVRWFGARAVALAGTALAFAALSLPYAYAVTRRRRRRAIAAVALVGAVAVAWLTLTTTAPPGPASDWTAPLVLRGALVMGFALAVPNYLTGATLRRSLADAPLGSLPLLAVGYLLVLAVGGCAISVTFSPVPLVAAAWILGGVLAATAAVRFRAPIASSIA